MDRIVDEHFGYEASDDVDGVVASMTDDAEHEILPSPFGPIRGRARIRTFYEGLFRELRGTGVTPMRRLYGEDFVVDETVWHGRIEDGRQFLLPGASGDASFRLLHVFNLAGGKIRREAVWCDLAAVQRQLAGKR
jgi:ketosteroid isomerase-like protein